MLRIGSLVLLVALVGCPAPSRSADQGDGGTNAALPDASWSDAQSSDAQADDGCHPLFAPQQIYSAGSYPNAVAVGDLDGDHDPDLAITNFMANTVMLRFNQGDGTFPTSTTLPVGEGPASLIIEDRDGDANLDLVVANHYGNNLSILLGTGQGEFAPQVLYPAAPDTLKWPTSIVAADFNGDQKSDFAVADEYDWVANVLLSSGPLAFAVQGGFQTARLPTAMVAADLDGDGKSDLALAHNNQDLVGVLLGHGDGTFDPQETYPAGDCSTDIAAGDLNGDGAPDLVVVNFCSQNTLTILLNDGSGGFTATQTSYPSTNAAVAVALVDIDSDGRTDMLVTNASLAPALAVLLGNGDGSFTEEGSYPVGQEPVSVTVADLDGDGTLDAVVANPFASSVSVLLNRCAHEPVDLVDSK
jgi:hypothetical protein